MPVSPYTIIKVIYMEKNNPLKAYGFTLVELLIVIVVIAILAVISIVAYNGAQKRATEAILQSDLTQARAYMEHQNIETGSYPTSTDDIPKNEITSYELALSGDSTFCLTATTSSANASPYHISSGGGVKSGPCQGHSYGGPAPAGVNIAPPLDQWVLSGGATYDSIAKEVTLHNVGSTAVSPFIRVDAPKTFRMSVEINSPIREGEAGGQHRYSTEYFDKNYSRYVLNNNYSTNGDARIIPANTWTRSEWGMNATGPDYMYLKYIVLVSSDYGVAGTRIRNPSVTLTR